MDTCPADTEQLVPPDRCGSAEARGR